MRLLLVFASITLVTLFACGPAQLPAPPPAGQWRVEWLPTGGTNIEGARPGMNWRMRVDHTGPERELEIVCETTLDGKLQTPELLLSTPLLEVARVDKGTYVTIDNVAAKESLYVNLRVTLIDLSRHLKGNENAYLQIQRWGRRDEGHAITEDALVSIPALSASGDQGSGPSMRMGGSVQSIDEEVELSARASYYRDPTEGPRVESRLVLRLR